MADQAEKDIEVPEEGMPMLARTTVGWGNVLCGYRWPNAVDVERDLLRKIIRAEVGGL